MFRDMNEVKLLNTENASEDNVYNYALSLVGSEDRVFNYSDKVKVHTNKKDKCDIIVAFL